MAQCRSVRGHGRHAARRGPAGRPGRGPARPQFPRHQRAQRRHAAVPNFLVRQDYNPSLVSMTGDMAGQTSVAIVAIPANGGTIRACSNLAPNPPGCTTNSVPNGLTVTISGTQFFATDIGNGGNP